MKHVPTSLRTWFIIHFIADLLFAIPLIIFPTVFLSWLGWTAVDPVTARLVGAALIGIGGESWLARDASLAVYRGMLRLKLLWSGAAILGFGLSLYQGAPLATWLFFGIFAIFFLVWAYWHQQLSTS